MLVGLGVGILSYVAFALVGDSLGVVVARALQGVSATFENRDSRFSSQPERFAFW